MYRFNTYFIFIIHLFCIQSYAFYLSPCSEPKCEIPDIIIQKTNEYIKSRVGDEYFSAFISFNTSDSHFRKSYRTAQSSECFELLNKPHYLLVYNISIPDIGNDVVTIEFIADTSGELISKCYLDKIPFCPDNNCWNYFPGIKKDIAIRIAMESGLEKGLKDWKVSFEFYSQEFNNYVWVIKNYLTLNNLNTNESRPGGEIIYISANDGSVVQINVWTIVP